MKTAHKEWNDVFEIWNEAKSIIKQGYKVLDKEVTMGLPGPCMPAISKDEDVGIGSPYGEGAKRVHKFFGGVIDKILLGPGGKTSKKYHHSPYCSEKTPNPFFIPLEYMVKDKLLKKEDLQEIYNNNNNNSEIDFAKVELAYQKALEKMTDKQIEKLANKYIKKCKFNYIGDIQVMIPNSICEKNKDIFFKDFTLGTPADALNPKETDWGFPVIKPEYIFNKVGGLGKGGKILYDIFYNTIASNKGGMRIDHFISIVNPFLCSRNEKYESARLYSSPKHPVLGKYAKRRLGDFGKIIEKILLKAVKDKRVKISSIYPEDIGTRPKQLDYILRKFGLGRLLVSVFVEIHDDNHMYRLKNACPNDVATIDTHDTQHLQEYIAGLDDTMRYMHARKLAEELRFNYNDDLKSDEQLFRMKWAELLLCPAKRVQAFFTSFTGQQGRYNTPGELESWKLRCDVDFDINYFKNLSAGKAYNPFDAICLAIYAKGDDFFEKNKDLVEKLRNTENELLERIQKK